MRDEAETITAEQRRAPLDRPVLAEPETMDAQDCITDIESEESAFLRFGHDGSDPLLPGARTTSDRPLEFVVERCPGEVEFEERSRDVGGQPDPVDGERLVSGVAQPREDDEFGRGVDTELRRRERIPRPTQLEHSAALGEPGLLHDLKQAVERPEGALDPLMVDGCAHAARATDDAVDAEPAHGMARRVAAHAVDLHQFTVGREADPEVTEVEPTSQLILELEPQRAAVVPAERACPLTERDLSGLGGHDSCISLVGGQPEVTGSEFVGLRNGLQRPGVP